MNRWLLLLGAVFVVLSVDDFFLRRRLTQSHQEGARIADTVTRTLRTNEKLFEVATSCQSILGETTISKQQAALRKLSPEAKRLMRTMAEQKKNRSTKVASANGSH